MSRRLKLVLLAAVALCLIVVPVTLADFDGSTTAVRPPGHPTSTGAARRFAGTTGLVNRRAAVRQAPDGAATVVIGPAIRPISPSYLGLSIEYWGLPLFERHHGAFARMLSLLQVGNAPLILRVGGDSADRSFWDPGRRLPQWAFRLMPRWLGLTRWLVGHSQARLILDLNLVTSSPLRAAAWARAAEAKLPRGSILGFEIGNEPDIYDRPYWLATIAHVGQNSSVLPAAISPQSYLRAFRTYAHALNRFAPGVPLLGPAVANPTRSIGWITQLVAHARPLLGTISAHRYPYSACLGPRSAASPTLARILSEHASAGNAQLVRAAASTAHRAGLPFRMTELNSVTCGGRAGVSDTFATALWAPDALFELIRNGVDGVNIHVRADTVNAAMVPAANGIRARPLLYGLIMFARALGTDSRLASLRLQQASSLHLKAWAVRANGSLRVLLINKGATAARVLLRVPGAAVASVQRLTAPSAASKVGETLNGQTLSRAGTWQGAPTHELLAPGPVGYTVRVPAASAALIFIR